MHELKVKRVYQESDAADGIRILVDRMWPRGISKDRMPIMRSFSLRGK